MIKILKRLLFVLICWWVFPLNMIITSLLVIPYYIITGKNSMDSKLFKKINDWLLDLTE